MDGLNKQAEKQKPCITAGLFVFWLLDLGSNQGHTD